MTKFEGEITPMNEKHKALVDERRTLRDKLRGVEVQIASVDRQIKSKQAEVDDKSSVLKITELVQSEGDSVEIIRLTEQLNGQL